MVVSLQAQALLPASAPFDRSICSLPVKVLRNGDRVRIELRDNIESAVHFSDASSISRNQIHARERSAL